jgi:hypothetical protein
VCDGRAAGGGGGGPYVTVKDCDAVASVVSVSVTVQLAVPDHVAPVPTTRGRKVMELSELRVNLALQFASPLFQMAFPLTAPLQIKATWLTLLKLAPTAESVAS